MDHTEVFEVGVAVADRAVEHEQLEQILESRRTILDTDEFACAAKHAGSVAALVLVGAR